jgi:hypothetical protein
VPAARDPITANDPTTQTPTARTNKTWYWLLLIPYLAIFWLPSYNSVEPVALGVPFFYWYQLLWVVLSTMVIGIVFYFAHVAPQSSRKRHNASARTR